MSVPLKIYSKLDIENIPTYEVLFKENKILNNEIKRLEKQLNYLRSREYINQLKFEINMLEDLVSVKELSNKDYSIKKMMKANTILCV